jgi:hypothetical protein
MPFVADLTLLPARQANNLFANHCMHNSSSAWLCHYYVMASEAFLNGQLVCFELRVDYLYKILAGCIICLVSW